MLKKFLIWAGCIVLLVVASYFVGNPYFDALAAFAALVSGIYISLDQMRQGPKKEAKITEIPIDTSKLPKNPVEILTNPPKFPDLRQP